MTNPIRIKTIETFMDGQEPLTKLSSEKGDDDFLVDLLRKKHDTNKVTLTQICKNKIIAWFIAWSRVLFSQIRFMSTLLLISIQTK